MNIVIIIFAALSWITSTALMMVTNQTTEAMRRFDMTNMARRLFYITLLVFIGFLVALLTQR